MHTRIFDTFYFFHQSNLASSALNFIASSSRVCFTESIKVWISDKTVLRLLLLLLTKLAYVIREKSFFIFPSNPFPSGNRSLKTEIDHFYKLHKWGPLTQKIFATICRFIFFYAFQYNISLSTLLWLTEVAILKTRCGAFCYITTIVLIHCCRHGILQLTE